MTNAFQRFHRKGASRLVARTMSSLFLKEISHAGA